MVIAILVMFLMMVRVQGRAEILHHLGVSRFIPLDELENEDYGQYNRLFESQEGEK